MKFEHWYCKYCDKIVQTASGDVEKWIKTAKGWKCPGCDQRIQEQNNAAISQRICTRCKDKTKQYDDEWRKRASGWKCGQCIKEIDTMWDTWTCKRCKETKAYNDNWRQTRKGWYCEQCKDAQGLDAVGSNEYECSRCHQTKAFDETTWKRSQRSGWRCPECVAEVEQLQLALNEEPDEWDCSRCKKTKPWDRATWHKPLRSGWRCPECVAEVEQLQLALNEDPKEWDCKRCKKTKAFDRATWKRSQRSGWRCPECVAEVGRAQEEPTSWTCKYCSTVSDCKDGWVKTRHGLKCAECVWKQGTYECAWCSVRGELNLEWKVINGTEYYCPNCKYWLKE